ncbi:MAG: hypothetical protein BWY57_01976 [Betaproteobacteria bacterium ADurb.Bin341]|nr:MAG: hypothetical protein BWY57_01976 [Betaproteobacteria bacterium ADurb.Bin341]
MGKAVASDGSVAVTDAPAPGVNVPFMMDRLTKPDVVRADHVNVSTPVLVTA